MTFVQDEESQFNLTRLQQKISCFVKSNPDSARKFYIEIENIYNQIISDCKTTTIPSQVPKIKNPLVNKRKGRPPNKRFKTSLEKNKTKKRSCKDQSNQEKEAEQQSEMMRNEMRSNEMRNDGVRNEMRNDGMRNEVHGKMRDEIQSEIRDEIWDEMHEIRDEMNDEVETICDEIMQDEYHCPSPPTYKYLNLQHFPSLDEDELLESGIG